jgi:hypothetical protein
MIILKCNREQFEALNNLFNHLLNDKPADIKNSLVHDLLMPIKIKLNARIKKSEGIKGSAYNKVGWNLSLTELQAKIYYTFFESRYLGEKWGYEMNFINMHLKELNKLLA